MRWFKLKNLFSESPLTILTNTYVFEKSIQPINSFVANLMEYRKCLFFNLEWLAMHRFAINAYSSVLNNRPLLIIILGDIQAIKTRYLSDQYLCSLSRLIKIWIKTQNQSLSFVGLKLWIWEGIEISSRQIMYRIKTKGFLGTLE